MVWGTQRGEPTRIRHLCILNELNFGLQMDQITHVRVLGVSEFFQTHLMVPHLQKAIKPCAP